MLIFKKEHFSFIRAILFLITPVASFLLLRPMPAYSPASPLIVFYLLVLALWIINLIVFFVGFKLRPKGKLINIARVVQFIGLIFISSFFFLQLMFVWPAVIGSGFCELKGPKFNYVYTNHNSGECFRLSSDESKVCEQSSDCEGFCVANRVLAEIPVNEKGNLTGKCTSYTKPSMSYDDRRFCRTYLETSTKEKNKDLLICGFSAKGDTYSDTWISNYEWKLTKYKLNGNEFEKPLEDTVPTLRFFTTNAMTGFDGCNSFNAKYSQDNQSLVLTDFSQTKSGCGNNKDHLLSNTIQGLLKLKFFLSESKLVFRDEEGNNALIFSNEDQKFQ